MDISLINPALSAVSANPDLSSINGAVSVKMLANSIDATKQMSDSMVKMMENSVTPHIGGNFDISI